jgi:hypothetical protein
MKTILLFITAVTLSFSQNPELFSNEWHLEKMVVDDVDYTPPFPSQYNHTIFFDSNSISSGEHFIYCSYCMDYYYFLANISNEFISTIVENNPITECEYTENEFNYLSQVRFFFQNEGIINYVINEVDNYKQLVLTNLDNNQLYYNNISLSQENFLFENTVSLYPNPVQNILNIQNTASNLSKVQVYDLNGRLLQNYALPTNEVSLDVSQLNSGVYLVVLENEMGHQISRKIVKTTN